jgi:hypothetical protein
MVYQGALTSTGNIIVAVSTKSVSMKIFKIAEEGGDFSSFAGFEAGVQQEQEPVVGVITSSPRIIAQFTDFVANRFYESGPDYLRLVTDSGTALFERNGAEWIEILGLREKEPLPETGIILDATTRDLLKEELLARADNEQQRTVDLIVNSAMRALAHKIAEVIPHWRFEFNSTTLLLQLESSPGRIPRLVLQ